MKMEIPAGTLLLDMKICTVLQKKINHCKCEFHFFFVSVTSPLCINYNVEISGKQPSKTQLKY
jgi:hypothetical protein